MEKTDKPLTEPVWHLTLDEYQRNNLLGMFLVLYRSGIPVNTGDWFGEIPYMLHERGLHTDPADVGRTNLEIDHWIASVKRRADSAARAQALSDAARELEDMLQTVSFSSQADAFSLFETEIVALAARWRRGVTDCSLRPGRA